MRRRTTLGCLAVFIFLGCLLPASAICAAGNIGTYYLLRKPVALHDPAQIERAMDRIGGDVRALRGISDAAPIRRALITPDQLRVKMNAEFQKEYSRDQARDDLEEYAAFGVLDPAFDLYAFYLDTYTKYILGYYDPAEAELYVVSGAGFGASQRSTYAHEYMHGLQFQKHNLTADNWASGENSEIVSGKQALVEGEATFVEDMWQARYFSLGDQVDYYKQSLGALDANFFRIPSYLEQEIYFPYLEGRAFVAALYAEGGWSAVDAAFGDPPSSTEMILHPEKYLQREPPVKVADPVVPASFSVGWREIRTDVMGEFSTDLILATRVNAFRASQAAAGWGGDRYTVWQNDAAGSTAVAWHTRWDTQTDADDFFSTLREYDGARFGTGELGTGAVCWTAIVAACQAHSGTDVWWFYGPDLETAQSLMKSNLAQETMLAPGVSPLSIHFFPWMF
jgi:hypothetical protein